MKMKKTMFIALALAMLVPLIGSAYNFEEAAISNGYTITSTSLGLSSQGIDSLVGATNYTVAINIDLSQNFLSSLGGNPFFGLTSLKSLDLSDNPVTSIVYNTFSGLSALETLRLSGTGLQYIPDNYFEDLANLTNLDLASNQLGALGTNMFFGLVNLETLDLSGNQLISIFPGSFEYQSNLINLDASSNQLGFLDYVFFLLPSIEHVDLSGNQIISIDANSFIGAEALKTLDLSNSQVQTITSDAFSNLSNLETLSLNGNEISSILAGTFSSLSNVTHLGIQNGQVTSVPAHTFNGLSSITNLNLSHNLIGSILTNAFSGMPLVTSLDLTGNQLISVHDMMFLGAPQFESINFSSNNILSIADGTFASFVNLTSLALRNNQLTTVSTNQVSDLFDLQTLDLANNNIHTFGDGAFAGLTNLVFLDLSTNALASVNLNYAEFDLLTTLLIDSNIITNLSMEYATVSPLAFDAIMSAFDPAVVPAAMVFSEGSELIMAAEAPPVELESISLVGTDLSSVSLSALHELDTVTSLNLDGTSLDSDEIFTLITELDAMQESGAVLIVDEVVKADVFSELAEAGYSTTNGNVSADDLDSDGLPDNWETGYFGSINDPDAGRYDDSDGDTCQNFEEHIAGTDPTNGNSRFEVSSFLNLPSGKILSWEPVTGRVYSILWIDSLTNSFSVLTNGIVHPQNSYTDTVHSADDEGFYSIDVKLEN